MSDTTILPALRSAKTLATFFWTSAERLGFTAGMPMPSFFGYMLWSVGILVPLFTVAALVFFVFLPFPLW